MLYRKTVQESFLGIEYRHGQISNVLQPGVYWIGLGSGRKIELFDTRVLALRIPGQEVMLGDRTSLKVNVAGTYKVVDPIKLVRSVAQKELSDHLNQLVQLRLREVLSAVTLDELLGERAKQSDALTEVLSSAFSEIGLELVEIKLKDVILPADLRAAYTEALATQLRGKAQLEQARSQSAALRNLANSADLLEKHPQLIQLLSLQKNGAELNLYFDQPNAQK